MRIELIEAWYNGPEYLKKLQNRANNLRMMEADPLQRARLILDIYSVDPVAFIEDFCFILMPEYRNEIKPMFLFPYQKEIIYKLQEAEASGHDIELLIDKPRGMGLTWLFVAYFAWRWLFTPNWSGFVLSRSESEVDKGDADPSSSVFGKIRFQLDHMPGWILPDGFQRKGNKGTATDMKLRLLNPSMGTVIAGSSTNSNAGRSRRYSLIFIDECFSMERFNEVWRSLQSVARVKAFVSTVKPGRMFKDFKDMIEEAGNYMSLSWKDNPWKDDEWFEEQKKKAEFDPEVMKEVSADYSLSPKSQYYPEISQARVDDSVVYNRNLPLYCFLDFGKQDYTAIGWAQFDGRTIYIIDGYANSQKPLEFYVPFLNREISYDPGKYPDTSFLQKVRGWAKPVGFFGEVAHFQKSMPANISIAQELARYGVRLVANKYAIQHEPRRKATALLLPKMVFAGNPGALEFYDAVANSRYTSTISPTSKASVVKPVHDEKIADLRAALENFSVNFSRIIKSQRRESTDVDDSDRSLYRSVVEYLRV